MKLNNLFLHKYVYTNNYKTIVPKSRKIKNRRRLAKGKSKTKKRYTKVF